MSLLKHRTDGDGWVDCDCGQRHWGLYGSAGLMIVHPEYGVLLQHRAYWSHYGGTWGVPGGARASDEDAIDGAIREAHEEAAIPPDHVRPSHTWIEDHGAWSYTTVVASCDVEFEPRPNDPESLEISWVPVDDVAALSLHPAFGKLWPSIREQVHRRLVLVVDSANVVGSRPDGWWRDRAGAAGRLRDRLAEATSMAGEPFGLPPTTRWWPRVHLVVEGAARGLPSSPFISAPQLVVDHAPGSGDDAIVEVTGRARADRPDDHVVVVTSDRELRRRVADAGASTVGPGVLYDALDGTRQG